MRLTNNNTVSNIPAYLRSIPLLMVLLAAVAGSAWAQNHLYRYTNDKGVQVIDDDIPPEYVKNGYDVISKDGHVIQTVPRQLTEEELRLQNTEEARKRLREEERRRLQSWDESLMLRYSTIADIEAALARAISDIEIRISIMKSNRSSVKSQIERLQGKAADFERRGQSVPANVSDNIETLRQELEDIEESIAMRLQEIEEVKASYQRDMDRFTLLQDRIKIRSQSQRSKPVQQRKY